MKRVLMISVCLAAFGCTKDGGKAKTAAADPAFEQKWAELAHGGSEPLVIESDVHGAGLVGELRRATDAPHGSLVAQAEPVKGALPDEQVVRVIRANLAAMKSCYQVAERDSAVGSGKAIMSVEIRPDGAVSAVRIDAPAFERSSLPGCMGARAKAWTFPKFTQGPKRFSYPFVFVGG